MDVLEPELNRTGPTDPAREISRGMVGVYKEHLGRGPAHADTTITGDLVVCVLKDSLTRAEQSLIDSGDENIVRDIRRTFQRAMADELKAVVERATGRTAVTLLSDHSPDPDCAVEVVILGD